MNEYCTNTLVLNPSHSSLIVHYGPDESLLVVTVSRWLPTAIFKFPKRELGKKTVIKQFFNPSWFGHYKWLYYDEAQNAAFCHVCWCAADQKKLITSHKDAAFIYRGFRNWKDSAISMSRHESSDCHKEEYDYSTSSTTRDIGKQLSETHSHDQRDNRQLLLKLLQNIRLLAASWSPKYCSKRWQWWIWEQLCSSA